MKKLLLAAAILLTGVRAARAEPAIWLVQGAGAKVYLFGTLHVLPHEQAWFGPKISAAFDDSGEVWEEADVGLMKRQPPADLLTRGIAPQGDLWASLPAESAAKLRAVMKECHLPDSVVAHFRPWLASTLLETCELQAQTDAAMRGGANGPEVTLLRKAEAAGKPARFFETVEQQLDYLANAPDALQLKALRTAIDEAGKEDFAGMEAHWVAGDVGALDKLIAESKGEDPEVYRTIYVERNHRFATRIAEMARGTVNAFVAIGGGHFAGPDSVLVELGKLGVAAKRL